MQHLNLLTNFTRKNLEPFIFLISWQSLKLIFTKTDTGDILWQRKLIDDNQFDQGAFSQSNSSSTNYTLVSHVTGLWCHLLSPLSRVSTDSSFILIPCVKIEIPGRGGGDSRPLQHHLCKKSSTYKWLVFIAWINCEIDLGFPRSWTLSTWHYS